MEKRLKLSWQRFEDWLLLEPTEPLTLIERHLRTFARILFAVIRDALKGQLSLHAMSLVYTTILSLVPLLALSFSVLKAFNVQDKFTPMLEGFFAPMGEKGLEIQNNMLAFVDNMKVGVLGIVGFVLLFYTVISLVQKIEKAFNTIWFAPQLRSFAQRFSNYLSVILVGPVLVVSALSLTASTMNSSLVQALVAIEPFGTVILVLTKLAPFLMIIGAFTFFYVLMPNTPVKFLSALLGGVVAGCAWQTTSLLFTSFVVGSAKYDAIYSGFAVGILLLIWLYVNWLILLMGSSIAFYHQHGNHITKESKVESAPELIEKVGLEVMVQVARHFEASGKLIRQDELESRNHIPAILTRTIVDKLISHGLLLVAGEKSDRLAPGNSTDQITVADIFHALRQDDCSLINRIPASPAVTQVLDQVNQVMQSQLAQISLRSLINQ